MESAFAWIGQVVEWFGQFMPRWVIIDTTEGAVKFIRGSKVRALGPGIHWYWPATTKLVAVPVARQADDLRTQTMVTTDDKVIMVGGMIIHEVFDVIKLTAQTYDGPTTVKDITMTAIHDVCCRMTWEQLKDEQRKGTLDTKLKNAAKSMLEDYGVRVIKIMLTDLAPGRVHRVIQSTAIDG